MGGVSLKLFTSSLQEEVDAHQRSILRNFQTQIDSYIARLDQMSFSLATNTTILKGVEEGVSSESVASAVQFINEIQHTVLNTDIPINISVILKQYNAVYSHSAGILRQIEYPNSELLKLQWTGNTFYKIPPRTYQGQSDLLIVRPIPLNSSSPKGILVLHLDMVRLMEMVERTLPAKFSGQDARHRTLDVITTLDRTMQDMRHANERLMLQLNEQTPILKEHALLNLMRGVLSTDNDVSGNWRTYVETLQGDWFCVGVVEIDQMQELKQTYKEQDLSLIMYALRKLIEEIGDTYRPVLGVSTKHGQVAFLMGVDAPGEETDELVRRFAGSIHEQVKQFFAYSVSVALAEPKKGYENIHLSYKEAQSFMIYRLAMGPGALLLPEQIRTAVNSSLRHLIKLERAVVSCIIQGNYEQASAEAGELVRKASQSLHSLEALTGLFAHLVGELETAFQDYGVELGDIIGPDAIAQIYSLDRSEQLPIWLEERIIEPIRSHTEQLQVPKRKKAVQAALAMVQERLEDDLSLQQIADELQMPRPTLSKWFKEETGEDFREHLIRIRMDKAKEWLQHSDMPIKDMSDRLRYTSVPNFTRIFKQYTGMTPGAFRSGIRGGEGEAGE